MSLRQITLCLLRQGADMVTEDSDANVVKIIISKDGYVPLLVRQSMTEITAGLGIEQFPTAFGRVASPAMKWSNRESNETSVRS